MKNIKAVFFDLGGVLCELRGESHMRKLQGPSRSDDALWQAWIASPAVRAHESGQIDAQTFAELAIAEFSVDVSPAIYLQLLEDWLIGPYHGAHALLSETQARYQTALLSNIGPAHWARVESMDLLPRLHHAIPSFKLGVVKPERLFFERAMEIVGVPADEIIFFDDNQVNCDAAVACGIKAYRVKGVIQTRAMLVTLGLL